MTTKRDLLRGILGAGAAASVPKTSGPPIPPEVYSYPDSIARNLIQLPMPSETLNLIENAAWAAAKEYAERKQLEMDFKIASIQRLKSCSEAWKEATTRRLYRENREAWDVLKNLEQYVR